MTKRWLSIFLLGASLATSALATPLSLSFSGTFDEDDAHAGNLNPYAGMGETYSYQVSFNTDDFTPGASYSDSYQGYDDEYFLGQASWSGLVGSTPFAWTGPTVAYVRDGYTGSSGGGYYDLLNLSTYEAISQGASGDAAFLQVWAEGPATMSGTGLINFGFMNALALTGTAYANFTSNTSDGWWQGYARDNNPSVNWIQASVPEPTLVTVLSSL